MRRWARYDGGDHGKAFPDGNRASDFFRPLHSFFGGMVWSARAIAPSLIDAMREDSSDRLAFVRNEGFRTANLALPFKASADSSGSIGDWRA